MMRTMMKQQVLPLLALVLDCKVIIRFSNSS